MGSATHILQSIMLSIERVFNMEEKGRRLTLNNYEHI